MANPGCNRTVVKQAHRNVQSTWFRVPVGAEPWLSAMAPQLTSTWASAHFILLALLLTQLITFTDTPEKTQRWFFPRCIMGSICPVAELLDQCLFALLVSTPRAVTVLGRDWQRVRGIVTVTDLGEIYPTMVPLKRGNQYKRNIDTKHTEVTKCDHKNLQIPNWGKNQPN